MPQMIRNFHSMVISFGVYEVPLAVALISVQLGFVRETVEVFISFCLTEIFIEIRVVLGVLFLKITKWHIGYKRMSGLGSALTRLQMRCR